MGPRCLCVLFFKVSQVILTLSKIRDHTPKHLAYVLCRICEWGRCPLLQEPVETVGDNEKLNSFPETDFWGSGWRSAGGLVTSVGIPARSC